MSTPDLISVDFEVFGTVQGVFFRKAHLNLWNICRCDPSSSMGLLLHRRFTATNIPQIKNACMKISWFTKETATKRNCVGWVMNTREGTVKGVVQGKAKDLEFIEVWWHDQEKVEEMVMENGPTIVGDQWSDSELMEYLGARLIKEFGNNFEEYRCEDPPRMVLDKLEQRGYRVVSMTGVGQTCIWTLHKEATENQ